MSDKRPTPFTLTVCMPTHNHTFQFKTSSSARSAYSDIRASRAAYCMSISQMKPGDADPISLFHEIVDDFETRSMLLVSEIKSFRIADVMNEHRANMRLKLAELYAAMEFEDLVKNEHTVLTLIQARQKSSIIR